MRRYFRGNGKEQNRKGESVEYGTRASHGRGEGKEGEALESACLAVVVGGGVVMERT